MMSSLLIELATRLYFRAESRARRARRSTAAGSSLPARRTIRGFRTTRLKISVRSSSMSFVPSARHSIGSEVELVSFDPPDEHQHDAGVDRADKGVLRGQDARFAVGRRRSGEIHLRAVAQFQMPSMPARPGHGRFVDLGLGHHRPRGFFLRRRSVSSAIFPATVSVSRRPGFVQLPRRSDPGAGRFFADLAHDDGRGRLGAVFFGRQRGAALFEQPSTAIVG